MQLIYLVKTAKTLSGTVRCTDFCSIIFFYNIVAHTIWNVLMLCCLRALNTQTLSAKMSAIQGGELTPCARLDVIRCIKSFQSSLYDQSRGTAVSSAQMFAIEEQPFQEHAYSIATYKHSCTLCTRIEKLFKRQFCLRQNILSIAVG